MDPARQSVPEAGAYVRLRELLLELMRVERTLATIETAAPDAERAGPSNSSAISAGDSVDQ